MKKILIINQRGFGDAIILNYILNNTERYNYIIDVLTKEEYRSIFSSNNINSVITCNFFLTTKKISNLKLHVNILNKLRIVNYDIVVDYMGDFRERLIGKLCNGKKLVSVDRSDADFNKGIRRGLAFLSDSIINIPVDCINIYDQIFYVMKYIGLGVIKTDKYAKKEIKNIGLHPFASQECRMWTWEKWNDLIAYLVDIKHLNVTIFGSQKERVILDKEINSDVKDKITIFTETAENFINKLKMIDLLIGLDSFSLHAACDNDVNNIMLCGANKYDVWINPLCTVICKGKEYCQDWPCLNKPKKNCGYLCIKNIEVEDVIKTIDSIS